MRDGSCKVRYLAESRLAGLLIPSGETAKETVEAAFGDQAVWNGSAFVFEPGASRKQVLVPEISEVLAAHPHE